MHHLKEVFIANGYPGSKVRRTFSSAPRSREKDADEDTAKPMFLPYVRGVSEKLEKVCMCTFRGEDHLQIPEDTEEHGNASEAEDPNGEEKKCYL